MSYKVTIEPSGHEFSVDEGESVLDAALRHGLSLSYSCRNGVCGACKGKVVEGKIDYPGGETPRALTEAEAMIGQALLCQARPETDLVLEIHEVTSSNEIPIRKMPSRVVKLEQLAADVMRVYLKLPDTERMQFLAGQYIDVLLQDGRRRSFSLANAPHDDALLELHVRLVEDGEFTPRVFNEMKEKDILRIEGPFGDFYLREDSKRPIVMVAGGTGFAPIKAIIDHALQEDMQREIHLYWGVRSKADLYLDALPQEWAANNRVKYVPVLSEPKGEDAWSGRTGFVHQAVMQDFADLSGCDVYVSGPPVMVDAARQDFILSRKLPKEQFFFDSFDFANDKS